MEKIHIVSTKKASSKEIVGIQYLRGIAAIMVVICHTAEMANFPKYFDRNFLPTWLLSGSVGVHLFFVISGFIIAHVSLNDQARPKIGSSEFLTRRFVRIIPFMWFCIIGYAILRLLGRGTFTFTPYLRAMVLFPVGDLMPNQIWTLRHEFLFYLLFSLFILSVRPRWELLLVWFLSPVVWFWFGISDLFAPSFLHQLLDFLFHRLNLLFGFGFMIGILYNKGLLNYKLNITHGLIFFSILTIPLFFISQSRPFGKDYIIITGLFSSLIVVVSLFIYTNKSLSKLDKLGLDFGNSSYSIYLIHPAIISALLGIWSKIEPNANPIVVLFVCCTLSCFSGLLVHKFIENPLIKLAKQRFEQKRLVRNVSVNP